MTHLWVRAEHRSDEARVGLTPQGAASLIAQGFDVTVEDSDRRAIAIDGYRTAGADVAPEGAWREAPDDAIVLGLKDLPDDGTPLTHRHVMFGHAYKGQPEGRKLLERFRAGGGVLYDLEYLTDEDGRRVAAFGYWAGYAGAAVSLLAWAAQQQGGLCGRVTAHDTSRDLFALVQAELMAAGASRPNALIIGALGRVGTGARDLCSALSVRPTLWDMAETAGGGPFPQILSHHILLNCILARPGSPVFVEPDATEAIRALSVIGDIACDPGSDYSPIKVYDRGTTWDSPVRRVHDVPPLDVMAIDNLPAMLPMESSEDFAKQLLPTLRLLDGLDEGPWARAKVEFDRAIEAL